MRIQQYYNGAQWLMPDAMHHTNYFKEIEKEKRWIWFYEHMGAIGIVVGIVFFILTVLWALPYYLWTV